MKHSPLASRLEILTQRTNRLLAAVFASLFTSAILATSAAAQCGTGNSDCVGSDCISSTSAGAGNVEYALGSSTLGSDGRLLFNSFKEDTLATGAKNGSTTTNTASSFVRAGGDSIKHAVWSSPKRAEINDLSFDHPIKDTSGTSYYYWYGWSYFIPNDSNWNQTVNPLVEGETALDQYIGQWRFSNLSGCATMKNGNNANVGGSGHHLQYRGGRLFYTMTLRDPYFTGGVNRLKQIEFDLGTAAKGVWMDFVIQAKWTSGNSGVFNLWIQKNNGGYTQIVDYNGPTWFTYDVNDACSYSGQEANAPNWQVGMYWSNDKPSSATPRVMYSDQIRMRRTICPSTTGSDGWNKVLPAPGSVKAPSLVPALGINPIEMEKLTYTTSTGDTATNTSNPLASELRHIKFNGASVGDFLQTTIYAPVAAAYRISLRALTATNGSNALLSVNGAAVGSWNQSATTGTFTEKDYGVINLNRGNNTFRWELSGTAGTSSNYSLDYMMLESSSAGAPDISGTYKIVNKNSGKALRPLGGASGDNVNVTQFTYTSTWTNEHWTLTQQSDGFYEIKNVYSGKLLRPRDGSNADNAQIVQFTDNNFDSQRWQIIDAGGGFYKIKNKYSGKLLLPFGSGTANDVNIVQLPDGGLNSQLWQIAAR